MFQKLVKIGQKLGSRCWLSSPDGWTPDTKVILYSVRCCTLHWTDNNTLERCVTHVTCQHKNTEGNTLKRRVTQFKCPHKILAKSDTGEKCGSCGGRNFTSPIEKAHRLYNGNCCYRTSRDFTHWLFCHISDKNTVKLQDKINVQWVNFGAGHSIWLLFYSQHI